MQVMNVHTHSIHHHIEALVLACAVTSTHTPSLSAVLVKKRFLEHLTYFLLGIENPPTG